MNFDSATLVVSTLGDRDTDLRMNITTRFAHPPTGDREIAVAGENLAVGDHDRAAVLPNAALGDLEPVSFDDLFPVFTDYDVGWPIGSGIA